MSSILALWATLLTLLAPVRGVSIALVDGRTEVLIHVAGQVSAHDFVLRGPNRLVIDITGAQHALQHDRFTGVNRGGILGLRINQREPEVVRIVLDLAQAVKYEIQRQGDDIVVSFPNPVGAFEPWSTGDVGSSVVAQEPARTPRNPIQRARDAAAATEAQGNQQQPVQQPVRDIPSTSRNQPLGNPPADVRTIPSTTQNIPLGQPTGAVQTPAQTPAQKPRITISFNELPILDVLSTFSELSGRSIVAGTGVTGTLVTADIKNQPWDVALDAILASQGLASQETVSGIIRVDKIETIRATEKTEALVTRQFKIRYINADSLLPALSGVKSDSGKAAVAKGTNTLIVTDRPAVIARLAPLIQQLDVRTAQVSISAKIIFIDRTALEQLGIVYDIKDSRGSQLNTIVQGAQDLNGNGIFEANEATNNNLILLGGNSIAALGNATNRVAAPTLTLVSTLVLGRHSLINFLEATQSLSLSDIQAAPVVTTLDNREASIQVGEKTPIRVVDAGSNSVGSASTARASVTLQNTGVILRVTPHITGDQILLELHAERSNVALAPGDIGLTFQTQEANTQVLVQDGETAVIGGLTIIDKSKTRAGIPVLMDLPVLGALFRNTNERENKRDLLIMVTPHIIRDTEIAPSKE
jgi:type IV pilus assembly protein PilQ